MPFQLPRALVWKVVLSIVRLACPFLSGGTKDMNSDQCLSSRVQGLWIEIQTALSFE